MNESNCTINSTALWYDPTGKLIVTRQEVEEALSHHLALLSMNHAGIEDCTCETLRKLLAAFPGQ